RPPDPPASGSDSRRADADTREGVRAMVSKLPLYFVENRGQEDGRVGYYVHGRDTAVYFTRTGVTFALSDTPARRVDIDRPGRRHEIRPVALSPAAASPRRWAVQLDFVGANTVAPRGEDRSSAVVSYFTGGPDQEQAGLTTYRSVVYPDLWPGIDLVYTGTDGQLKYTFHIKPGADPS